ncbi:keratin, type I cytoskeletal 19-like [Carcharodon carcharias]|uniref:keratin, type I cytoskeletal 19-like n=1 Tax=Carcharodon carcharias TaxID=13397 RepID=UPI001B7E14B0|nr:keratin, type I cytoskeletal 19-like [Carcharodon carcharias]
MSLIFPSVQTRSGSRKSTGSSVILSSSKSGRLSVASAGSKSRRAVSVYSNPIRSTRISTASSGYGGLYSGGYSSGSFGLFSVNEKQTMQNLNDRLALYLEKVRSLEKSNNQLERQIREFYEKRTPSGTKDLGSYWKTISELRAQINDASLANARVLLQIDNAKLAADDFKTKYEAEYSIRCGVEMDIAGLRKVLDELTFTRSDLESQIEQLKEETIYTKKNHEEELKSLHNQIRGTVTVDVDSTPGTDLTKALAEIREKYELISAKNQKEAESWYKEQSANLQQTVVTNTEMIQTEKSQLTEQRRKLQALEIELQTMLSVKMSLEDSLQEIEDRYAVELNRLQGIMADREAEFMHIQTEMERKTQEYAQLLDVKSRLEMEIATYRHLLEGEEDRYVTEIKTETVHDPTVVTTKKVVTITETIVDGKVVESHQEVNVK